MSSATPVLERRVNSQSEATLGSFSQAEMDKLHNARISEAYARLINPATKLSDYKAEEITPYQVEQPATKPVVIAPVAKKEEPYFVQSARTDAEIFRADSIINRKPMVTAVTAAPVAVETSEIEEEESEDLRPTLTTIQYRSVGVAKTLEEGKLANEGAEKRIVLSKRDKVVIAVVVSIIVALFALIIINSAIISSISKDLGTLQSSLSTVKAAYAGISDSVNSFNENLAEIIDEFAQANGMIK